jgi:hypothetical protein
VKLASDIKNPLVCKVEIYPFCLYQDNIKKN